MQDLEQIIEQAFDNRAQGFEDQVGVPALVSEAPADHVPLELLPDHQDER